MKKTKPKKQWNVKMQERTLSMDAPENCFKCPFFRNGDPPGTCVCLLYKEEFSSANWTVRKPPDFCRIDKIYVTEKG